ncbi:MAG: integrase core domain-containing protein [Bacteroidaceae bacterium]|nr:integrase core domain-containing protein [Bacteroidaceae bacterium]
MTESYDPYTNAVTERVNDILKQKFSLEDYNYPIEIMRKIVAVAIRIYNRKRPHSSCAFMTSERIHQQNKKFKCIKSLIKGESL